MSCGADKWGREVDESSIYEARRRQLLSEIDQIQQQANFAGQIFPAAASNLARLYSELMTLDQLVVQRRLAAAQEDLAAATRQSTAAQLAETARIAGEGSEREEVSYWMRRFFTYLAVAHGAGAFATISALLSTPPPVASMSDVTRAMVCFGGGLLISGLIPIVHVMLRSSKSAQAALLALMYLSAILVLTGVLTTVSVAVTTYQKNVADPTAHVPAAPAAATAP